MNDILPFGRWLKRRRAELDLTQEALAEQVGCATQTIRTFENGTRRPSRELAERLATVLQLPVEEQAAFVRAARSSVGTTASSAPAGDAAPVPISPSAMPRTEPQRPLPLPTTPLIGREAELDMLSRRLVDPACRLLTLLGPGGIGKTRLALQAAAALAPRFADGAVWVGLAPVEAAEQVASTIADAVGCTFQGLEPPEAQLLAFLRERELLLVLDNFEHLLDATTLVAAVLDQAPLVRLLVTSRERLRVHGEWIVEVGGLRVPDEACETGSESSDAVVLFLERARRVNSSWVLGPDNQAAVVRICRLLDGVPLAIELAAAWLRTLVADEIADELDHSLDFLSLAERDAPPRHRSLRAVFEHSWRLLTAEEQVVLRKLAVFRGGFTRDAAAEVAGASLPVLASLVDKSLLRVGAGPSFRTRYDVHPLVRQYAAVYLMQDPAEAAAINARHTSYFASLLAAREARLKGAEQHAVVVELTADIDNIRAAWDWAVAQRKLATLEPAFEALHWLYEFRTWFAEGERLFRRAVEAFERAEPKPGATTVGEQSAPIDHDNAGLHGHLLVSHGYFASRRGELAFAQDQIQAGIKLLRGSNDDTPLVGALMYAGIVAFQMGDLQSAQQSVEESFNRATQRGDRWNIALSLTWLGILAQARGEFDLSSQRFRESLASWRIVGNPRGTLVCLTFFSITRYLLKQYDAAEAMLHESLALSEATDDRWGIGTALNHLGLVASARGAYADAQQLLRKSLVVLREGGNRWDITRALNNLANATAALGELEEAFSTYVDALRTAMEAHALPDALQALFGLASMYAQTDQPARALELLIYICEHPTSDQEIRDRAVQLRATIVQQLAPQEVAALEARGRVTPFDTFLMQVVRSTHSAAPSPVHQPDQ